MNAQTQVNRFLRLLLVIILLSLLIMLWIQLSSGYGHFGIHSDRIVDILEHNFIGFFNTFRGNSLDYMLFVSIIMFINMVTIVVIMLLKIPKAYLFNITIFIFSIFVTYQLPHSQLYHEYFVDHKLYYIMLCLFMMIFIPYMVGSSLGWDRITSMIFGKLICVIVYGLLLAQMLIEIRF